MQFLDTNPGLKTKWMKKNPIITHVFDRFNDVPIFPGQRNLKACISKLCKSTHFSISVGINIKNKQNKNCFLLMFDKATILANLTL